MLIAALLAPGVLRAHSQTGALSTLSPQPYWCLSCVGIVGITLGIAAMLLGFALKSQQKRRQGRQPQDCPVRVFRFSGQSTLSFSRSVRRWDQGPRAIVYGWQTSSRR